MAATMMSRQQIARRIHQLLLREIGHEIQIERLLAEPRYARDVLLVCDACPGGELVPLAGLFRQAETGAPRPATVPGHARQPTEWAGDTSGFGVSQPPTEGLPRDATPLAHGQPPAVERRRRWLPDWMPGSK
jgi:hypothetical protein